MAYYVVKVEEVHISHMVVEADNKEEALACWTEGDEVKLEYNRRVDDLNREVVDFDIDEYTCAEISNSVYDLK